MLIRCFLRASGARLAGGREQGDAGNVQVEKPAPLTTALPPQAPSTPTERSKGLVPPSPLLRGKDKTQSLRNSPS